MKIKFLVLFMALSLVFAGLVACGQTTQSGESVGASESVEINDNEDGNPIISLNQKSVKICIGENFTFVATVENVKNASISWALDGEGESDVISFTEDGNVAVVTALKLGNAKLIAKTTVKGKTYFESAVIEVVEENQIVFYSNNLDFNDDGYYARISTLETELGDKSFVDATMSVYKNNKVVAADLNWEIDNEEVATVSNGKIKSVSEGVATVTVSCQIDGNTYSVKVSVEVYKPYIAIDEVVTVEVENLKTVTISYNIKGISQSVLYCGEEIGSYNSQSGEITFEKRKLPTSASFMGDERELIIETSLARYTLAVNMYTKVISNKQELDEMVTLSKNACPTNKAIWDGYFVLDSDIDYNGLFDCKIADIDSLYDVVGDSWFNGGLYGFRGVFDGKGHVIDGLSVTNKTSAKNVASMFGVLHIDGVVKNVAFTNASVAANTSLVCMAGGGSVENIYISYKSIGAGTQHYESNGTVNNYCGSFFGFKEPTATANVTNCVVDISNAQINRNAEIKAVGSEFATIKNVFVIGGSDTDRKNSNATLSFPTIIEFVENTNAQSRYKQFNSEIWSQVGGVPIPNAIYNLINDESVEFSSKPSVLVVGTSYRLELNNRYVSFVSSSGNVVVKGGVASVLDSGYNGENVTITAKSLFNDSISNSIKVSLRKLGPNAGVDLTNKGNVFYDITENKVYLAEVGEFISREILYYVNTDYTVATYNGDGGENKQIIAVTDSNLYTLTCQSVTKVLSKKEDLHYLRKDSVNESGISGLYGGVISGTFVMVNDIDCTGLTLKNPGNYWDNTRGFKGTLDGRGYAIKNLSIGAGGLFGVMSYATVKNVDFIGVKLVASDAEGYDGSYVSLLATSVYNTVISNVKIQFDTYIYANDLYHTSGLLFWEKCFDSTIKDVTIDISKIDRVKFLTELYYDEDAVATAVEKSIYDNVVVIVKDLKFVPAFAYNYKYEAPDPTAVPYPSGIIIKDAQGNEKTM